MRELFLLRTRYELGTCSRFVQPRHSSVAAAYVPSGYGELVYCCLTLLGLQSRFGDNWRQFTWNLSGLSPKRDWSSKRHETRSVQPRKYEVPDYTHEARSSHRSFQPRKYEVPDYTHEARSSHRSFQPRKYSCGPVLAVFNLERNRDGSNFNMNAGTLAAVESRFFRPFFVGFSRSKTDSWFVFFGLFSKNDRN